MDKTVLCESLMKWLQTFDLDAPHHTLEEISDGVAMAQALRQIAPEWFSAAWLSKIKVDAGNNWRLKVSNLKKIVEGIVNYYQEGLNQHIEEFSKLDVIKIGEKYDAAELGRLLQLILGCAVNCHHKQDYITEIMAMEESVQQVIMQAIQELEQSGHGNNLYTMGMSMGIDCQRLMGELEAATEARDQIAQRCHELDMQVTLLQEEKTILHMENVKLQDKLKEFETLEDSSVGSGHRFKEMRKQNDTLKEEMFKIETARDDFRLKVELQEKEILELQAKLEELQKTADEARHLKDEIDILRETAEKAVNYEATISSYKKKLEEYSDLKRQIKILEEKNTDYVQQIMELEEEVKKSVTWKPHLEMYKLQNLELHQKLSDETKRADKFEFECKKLTERLSSVQRENERLIVERDMLRESNEELKCSQLQMRGSSVTNPPNTLLAETVPENVISPDIKEKLARLEHENKLLRQNQREQEAEQLAVALGLLDDANRQVNKLQLDSRVTNQRILELESQLEELQEPGSTGIRQRLTELQDQVRVAQHERDQKSVLLEERDASLVESKQKVAMLQEMLKRKEMEIQGLEERYRKYIEKAKSVIKSLDPKQNTGSADVVILRNQLLAKHKMIEALEEEKEQGKICREMEEKLMASAFYKLGLVKQQESVDHRLAALGSGQGQSFLGRQRQATIRRTVHNYDSR
ncbi:protein Hook homolog isoform X2 [Bacillus rossius redtenbacheri]|uniref:protein Hook homolog isoform X2 n=1 Tax=Bacillus rossius redtenbacheri TaxID=93214 RepID=UPI002FDEF59B